MEIIKSIQNRIYELRGERVMLDFDLSDLYQVETRILNQSVKRNFKRFPLDFMFQLTEIEWRQLQVKLTVPPQNNLISQIVISSWGGNRKAPYAFTEQGVAMLSGILNSNIAINMNIAIMRAFIAVRKLTIQHMDLKQQLQEIKERLGEHDSLLNQIYDALENILDEKAAQRKWDERDKIGF